MGSKLHTSPNVIATAIVAALVMSTAVGAPAFAKTTVQGGQNACKEAFRAQSPAPTSVRIDASETKAKADTLTYTYRVKAAGEDAFSDVICTVNRETNAVTLTPDAAKTTTLATR